MNKEKFSSEAVSVVEECIEMFDVESLVEHALYYVSVYHSAVLEYVLDNIEDSEELIHEEREYLSERVQEYIDKYL
jgi:hypothetical protein